MALGARGTLQLFKEHLARTVWIQEQVCVCGTSMYQAFPANLFVVPFWLCLTRPCWVSSQSFLGLTCWDVLKFSQEGGSGHRISSTGPMCDVLDGVAPREGNAPYGEHRKASPIICL